MISLFEKQVVEESSEEERKTLFFILPSYGLIIILSHAMEQHFSIPPADKSCFNNFLPHKRASYFENVISIYSSDVNDG